jgi:fumarylpyruvate hydrolase
MSYVIEPSPLPTLGVKGSSKKFPVSQIYCVGRNYADHAVEMGGDPDREPPFFFMKPGYSVLSQGIEMIYPNLSNDVHHEVELVVALGQGGQDIPVDKAMSLVYGYAVGIDMTRRDLQSEAKDKRRPWEAGKSFLHAAPCSNIAPLELTGEISSAEIFLDINGVPRQSGNVNQMIWKVPEVISRLSELFVLQAGDLIFTGTPAGVGPIERGDRIEAGVATVGTLIVKVASG